MLLRQGSLAFRRRIAPEELDPLVVLFSSRLEAGDSYADALRGPLRALLLHPSFLFREEHDEPGQNEWRLNDFELATRLSYVEQYAYMLARMKEIKEGDGTLLDHSMAAFGSPIRDGNSHNPRNVPIVVAGKANGRLRTGRHLGYENGTPLCRLWLGMLERAGVQAKSLGDATRSLANLG